MDYLTLRIIHITGIVMTFMGLTGILALKLGGGSAQLRTRLIFHLSHGLGLITIIVSGFMLAHVLNLNPPPGWLYGKFVIWLLAAGSMVLANRFFRFAPWIVLFFIALGATAAYLAIYKP
jgi:hypothetical protein